MGAVGRGGGAPTRPYHVRGGFLLPLLPLSSPMAMGAPALTWPDHLHRRRNPNVVLPQSPPPGQPASPESLLRSPDLEKKTTWHLLDCVEKFE